MKFKIVFLLLTIIVFVNNLNATQNIQEFNRSAFYGVMKTGGINEIDTQLALVNDASIKEKDAYKGALLMKKAGLVKKAKDKLDLFKSGRISFEKAIRSDTDNAEYRFLRLAIQEHTPKVVKYKDKLETDRQFIQKHYKNLSPVVQQAIIDYSKTSKVLLPQDL